MCQENLKYGLLSPHQQHMVRTCPILLGKKLTSKGEANFARLLADFSGGIRVSLKPSDKKQITKAKPREEPSDYIFSLGWRNTSGFLGQRGKHCSPKPSQERGAVIFENGGGEKYLQPRRFLHARKKTKPL